MTIGGAIAELQNLIDADDVPFYYKGGINKVIETIQMEVNEQNRLLKEIAHRLDLHERAMAKAMRDTADTPQTDCGWMYDSRRDYEYDKALDEMERNFVEFEEFDDGEQETDTTDR